MRPDRKILLAGALGFAALCLAAGVSSQSAPKPITLTTLNAAGRLTTVVTHGTLDRSNPFFQPLGSNGRSCSTCHSPASGWSLSGRSIQDRFTLTGGKDPLFMTVDASNSPDAVTTTLADRQLAFSLLLNRGVFRLGFAPPEGELSFATIPDPNFSLPINMISVFRRPLPSTNLLFAPSLMWDGRGFASGFTLQELLQSQAQQAATDHLQLFNPLSFTQLGAIAQFESGLFTAQTFDTQALSLDGGGISGGIGGLERQTFFPGINDEPLDNTVGRPGAFQLFSRWKRPGLGGKGVAGARNLIAQGEAIFNTRKFIVMGVRGFNDVHGQDRIQATCATCHNTPTVGSRSRNQLMGLDIHSILRDVSDLPQYTVQNRTTGETAITTDPGQALVTGKWADLNKFRVPALRALAARAPYFHDGSAGTLHDVVEFYYNRFNIQAGPGEKDALEAFLRSL